VYAPLLELCSCCVAGTGELRYAWSSVCMHYFSTAFLVAMADRLKQQGQYHIAHKKIPSKDGPVQVTDSILHLRNMHGHTHYVICTIYVYTCMYIMYDNVSEPFCSAVHAVVDTDTQTAVADCTRFA